METTRGVLLSRYLQSSGERNVSILNNLRQSEARAVNESMQEQLWETKEM